MLLNLEVPWTMEHIFFLQILLLFYIWMQIWLIYVSYFSMQQKAWNHTLSSGYPNN